jgi:hypothetical protein
MALWPRVRHDSVSGEKSCPRSVHLGASKRDTELTVAVRIDPSHRPAVAAPVHALEIPDRFHRRRTRRAADGGRWVQQPGDLKRGVIPGRRPRNTRRDVLDVRQRQQKRSFGREPVAQATENVGHRFDREPMLTVVLGGVQQRRADLLVFGLVFSPARRTSQHQ